MSVVVLWISKSANTTFPFPSSSAFPSPLLQSTRAPGLQTHLEFQTLSIINLSVNFYILTSIVTIIDSLFARKLLCPSEHMALNSCLSQTCAAQMNGDVERDREWEC